MEAELKPAFTSLSLKLLCRELGCRFTTLSLWWMFGVYLNLGYSLGENTYS